MSERAIQSLRDALIEAENLIDDLEGVAYEDFETSRQFTRMTERSLEVIGEAVRRALDADYSLQAEHPELREWVSLRNVISHQYERVLPSTLWTTVHEDLPGLVNQLQRLIGPPRGN